ncbi:hypothetical protein [Spirosoma soli]|uniref:hypothetical protein n=1 Tax=Spirosoma soli TaxID=1770529 RepID=UPI0036D22248
MRAIRIHTQIDQNHELVLCNLPLSKGKNLEVIIIEEEADVKLNLNDRFPLRGKPIRFDNPFGSATDVSDWDATL